MGYFCTQVTFSAVLIDINHILNKTMVQTTLAHQQPSAQVADIFKFQSDFSIDMKTELTQPGEMGETY